MTDYLTEAEVEELSILLKKIAEDFQLDEHLKAGRPVVTQSRALMYFKVVPLPPEKGDLAKDGDAYINGLNERRDIKSRFREYNELFYKTAAMCPLMMSLEDMEESIEIHVRLIPNDFIGAEKHLEHASRKWKEMRTNEEEKKSTIKS